jgi:hypothetical protein
MKKLCSLIRIFVCIFPFFIFGSQREDDSPHIKIAGKLMKKVSTKLEKKYKFKLVGVKQAMLRCVNLMGFRFQIFRAVEKKEARAMVVDCLQEFLKEVNENKEIRPYLKNYPFDIKDLEVIIFIGTPDYGTFYHPNLAVVSAYMGKIRYSTKDPFDKYNYKSEEVETFEEAVKILKGECLNP